MYAVSSELAQFLEEGMNKEELREHHEFNQELMETVEGLSAANPDTVFMMMRENKGPAQTMFDGHWLEWSLDNAFCHALVKQIPTIVLRALQLEPLVVGELPTGPVNIYLREATRSYLFGLFIAVVALSRSALEQALEERVSRLLQTDSKDEKLMRLIRGAELSKVLQGETLYLAHDVRRSANKVVHGEACAETAAFDILIKTRTVVKAIFGERLK